MYKTCSRYFLKTCWTHNEDCEYFWYCPKQTPSLSKKFYSIAFSSKIFFLEVRIHILWKLALKFKEILKNMLWSFEYILWKLYLRNFFTSFSDYLQNILRISVKIRYNLKKFSRNALKNFSNFIKILEIFPTFPQFTPNFPNNFSKIILENYDNYSTRSLSSRWSKTLFWGENLKNATKILLQMRSFLRKIGAADWPNNCLRIWSSKTFFGNFFYFTLGNGS